MVRNSDAGDAGEPARDEQRLTSLAGRVRESVTAVENLLALVRSPRVGPRQLASALPSFGDETPGSASDLRALGPHAAEVLAAHPTAKTALDRLVEEASGHIDELVRELRRLTGERLGARSRLELESSVSALAAELELVCRLAELLAAVAAPRPTRADLGEMGTVTSELRLSGEGSFSGDPRIVSGLLQLAGGRNTPEGTVSRESGRLVVDVVRGADLPPAGDAWLVASALAEVAGYGLESAESGLARLRL